ncbi:hypothetical protein NPIL_253161 [Nephila pilipes]|uniref:Uncharacterized protein n=1 Tax=Nephila pilipes TaxID=299642 RepID=A0A8X6PYA8_NEPPI|nr:hypothetical protein NPIL_286161 [Nephila pilipes]GFT89949.1 hypothetical protein NPIL_253161 [Nephila pilipes]
MHADILHNTHLLILRTIPQHYFTFLSNSKSIRLLYTKRFYGTIPRHQTKHLAIHFQRPPQHGVSESVTGLRKELERLHSTFSAATYPFSSPLDGKE